MAALHPFVTTELWLIGQQTAQIQKAGIALKHVERILSPCGKVLSDALLKAQTAQNASETTNVCLVDADILSAGDAKTLQTASQTNTAFLVLAKNRLDLVSYA